MSEVSEKTAKLRGFAGFINNLINAAIKNEECKDFIRGIKTRVLLNNLEDKYAVIITIKDDKIKVEEINKDENPDLSRKKFFYYGYWQFPNLQTMMSATGWKLGKWIRKMARGTVKGASQIAIIGQVLSYATPKKEKLKLKT
jgi:hypothetical protein